MLYFAYGSNLHLGQMRHRCRQSQLIGWAVLPDYRLVERGFADIEPKKGVKVYGAVFEITTDDLKALDIYEGFPNGYVRRWVKVTFENGNTLYALVYEMTPQYRKRLNGQKYSVQYRLVCAHGAEKCNLPVNEFKGGSHES